MTTYTETWTCNCCNKSHVLTIVSESADIDELSDEMFNENSPHWLPDAVLHDGTRIDLVGPCCFDRFEWIGNDFVEQTKETL